MEVEQWFFSRLLLDNFHLKREVIEMTEPLARLSRLWRSGSHSAVHPPSGTSSRTADTRSSASVSLKVSSDTAHSSQILAIARTELLGGGGILNLIHTGGTTFFTLFHQLEKW